MFRLSWTIAVATPLIPPDPAQAAQSVKGVVETFGNAAIQEGLAVGVEVGVIIGNGKPHFYSFGVANTMTQQAPAPNTLFYLASLTKVFTTNLLAQEVLNGTYSLSQPLSDFAAMTGPLPPLSGTVTLQQLGDFTSGFPATSPVCRVGGGSPGTTGCIPSVDPSLTDYDSQDFLTFFQTYALPGPPPNSFEYSSFGIGLTGLLMGGTPGQLLTNDALTGWGNLVQSQIAQPLGMASTYLNVPATEVPRVAPGYDLAQGNVVTQGDEVTQINVTYAGGRYYDAPPSVMITGGGGSGAEAHAVLDPSNSSVANVVVDAGGHGYTNAPSVAFSGGAPQQAARGRVIIQFGEVTGILITNGGTGYTGVPTVTISGGRSGGGDATAVAQVANGQVVFVTITNGGGGYLPPLQAIFTPSSPSAGLIPIWGAANALVSTPQDIATLAAAALGHTTIGTLRVPPYITKAFSMAETPYACQDIDPSLANCHTFETGLSWRIEPYAPATTSKDGSGGGYSSYLVMMPGVNTAVVVLINSFNGLSQAALLGGEIIHGLYYAGLLPGPH